MAASNGNELLEIETGYAGDPFRRSLSRAEDGGTPGEDEAELVWAAIERLPSLSRLHFAVLRTDHDPSAPPTYELVDVRRLDHAASELVLHKALATADQDNYNLLAGIKGRTARVRLDVPKVEVTFENLTVSAKVHTGSRALPSLPNYVRDTVEAILTSLQLLRSNLHTLTILDNASGVVQPGRMTLLLGPPGSGKTTLLLSLAGKLDSTLKRTGDVKYNGCDLDKFCAQRTSAYISQTDNHIGELTVRETFNFAEDVRGLARAGQVASVGDGENNLVTEYTLKVLVLDVCANTLVGSDMVRGVSSGQKKPVTTVTRFFWPPETPLTISLPTKVFAQTSRPSTFKVPSRKDQEKYWSDKTKPYALVPSSAIVEMFKKSEYGRSIQSNLSVKDGIFFLSFSSL
ncbi:hypothetical protein Cni_G25327 [Canna indica]|uniref:AAA+ ATPase domain-containing protein n=1 Tax=Canna indica TaxID=4628 RepID=A0AAQ3KXN2_9LILI|nr:hypothetical protein Cni_G25327 [Canna indica]